MTAYSKLTRHYEDYLLRLCFGSEINLLSCIRAAYLDFNRTLHGVRKLENKDELHDKAISHLTDAFAGLKTKLSTSMEQAIFDGWHRSTCQNLISVYGDSCSFFGGQAQKWVNMTLKYVYTVGEERICGYQQAYPYCHVPLDNVMLTQLAKYGFPELSGSWSRIEYDEYFDRQEWIRKKFDPVPSLEVEFWLWLGKEPPGAIAARRS